MRLLIHNLGPIRGNIRTIDLSRRFIILNGYNNSGKTLVSRLISIIFDTSFIDRFSKSSDIFLPTPLSTSITISLGFINQVFNGYSSFLEKYLSKLSLFDSSFDFLIDPSDIHRVVHYPQSFLNNKFYRYPSINITKDNNSITFSTTKIKLYKEDLIKIVLHLFLGDIFNVFYLPSTNLIYSLLYEYSQESLTTKPENLRFSLPDQYQPITQIIKNLFNTPSPKNFYKDIVYQIQDILHGNLCFKTSDNNCLPKILFSKIGSLEPIPLYKTSSSAQKFAFLHSYFLYWVKRYNNFLFIEDLDEGLYPDNQIKILDLLIDFYTLNNNRVLISTINPLTADILNIFLLLDSLKGYTLNIPNSYFSKYIDVNTSLPPNDVSIYFFSGTSIIDYEVDYSGIYFRDFSHIRNSLNSIHNCLLDQLDSIH